MTAFFILLSCSVASYYALKSIRLSDENECLKRELEDIKANNKSDCDGFRELAQRIPDIFHFNEPVNEVIEKPVNVATKYKKKKK